MKQDQMKSIAEALVYAVTYINLRDDESTEENDVGALESIADILSNCTPKEKAALKEAAQRLLKQEMASANREDFVEDYQNWMEEMFPSDEDDEA